MSELRKYALVCFLLFVPQLAGAQRNAWIATWEASPQSVDPDADEPLLKIEGQTVRERVRVSIGGAQICIRLSNVFLLAQAFGSPNIQRTAEPALIYHGGSLFLTSDWRSWDFWYTN